MTSYNYIIVLFCALVFQAEIQSTVSFQRFGALKRSNFKSYPHFLYPLKNSPKQLTPHAQSNQRLYFETGNQAVISEETTKNVKSSPPLNIFKLLSVLWKRTIGAILTILFAPFSYLVAKIFVGKGRGKTQVKYTESPVPLESIEKILKNDEIESENNYLYVKEDEYKLKKEEDIAVARKQVEKRLEEIEKNKVLVSASKTNSEKIASSTVSSAVSNTVVGESTVGTNAKLVESVTLSTSAADPTLATSTSIPSTGGILGAAVAAVEQLLLPKPATIPTTNALSTATSSEVTSAVNQNTQAVQLGSGPLLGKGEEELPLSSENPVIMAVTADDLDTASVTKDPQTQSSAILVSMDSTSTSTVLESSPVAVSIIEDQTQQKTDGSLVFGTLQEKFASAISGFVAGVERFSEQLRQATSSAVLPATTQNDNQNAVGDLKESIRSSFPLYTSPSIKDEGESRPLSAVSSGPYDMLAVRSEDLEILSALRQELDQKEKSGTLSYAGVEAFYWLMLPAALYGTLSTVMMDEVF